MKRLILAICLLFSVVLCGCANTPNQQYTHAALAYDFAKVGATVAEARYPSIADKIKADLQPVQTALTDAKVWLIQNPQLADVVGVALPPLEPFNLALGILSTRLKALNLIDPTPPEPPATLPE